MAKKLIDLDGLSKALDINNQKLKQRLDNASGGRKRIHYTFDGHFSDIDGDGLYDAEGESPEFDEWMPGDTVCITCVADGSDYNGIIAAIDKNSIYALVFFYREWWYGDGNKVYPEFLAVRMSDGGDFDILSKAQGQTLYPQRYNVGTDLLSLQDIRTIDFTEDVRFDQVWDALKTGDTLISYGTGYTVELQIIAIREFENCKEIVVAAHEPGLHFVISRQIDLNYKWRMYADVATARHNAIY